MKKTAPPIKYDNQIKKKNIFNNPDWLNYDYQKDMMEDQELQLSSPIGMEKLEE